MITNAESVAMMRGGPAELEILDAKLQDICSFGLREVLRGSWMLFSPTLPGLKKQSGWTPCS